MRCSHKDKIREFVRVGDENVPDTFKPLLLRDFLGKYYVRNYINDYEFSEAEIGDYLIFEEALGEVFLISEEHFLAMYKIVKE